MSLFIYVFCQGESPISAREIIGFIDEGAYFEPSPTFRLEPASAQADDASWTEMKIEYKARKRPVILQRESRAEEFMEEVEEAIEALHTFKLAKKHEDLVARLKGTRQLIVFELDARGTTEECWEMVDNLESWIARERNGLIYVAGEGFYDAELQPICKF